MYKKIALLLLLGAILASCGARKSTVTSSKKITGTQKDILDYGMKYLNKPYRYAAKGPHAFDCSGFTSFVFREFGYRLSTSSSGQDQQFPSIRKKEDLQPGDLVFFEGRARNGRVGHVGIVKELLSNGEFRFLHASTSNGVIVSRSSESYYAARYLRGGRVLQENNRIITVNRTPEEEPQTTPVADKRKKAFIPAKAKEQVAVGAPKTQTEREVEVALAQNPRTSELEEIKRDTVIVHTRTIDLPVPETSRNKNNQEEVSPIVTQVTTQPDTTSIPKPVETEIAAGNFVSHEVKPGETLFSISQKYNCSVEQIRQWNPQLGAGLKAGETITVKF
ncbi:MAG: NlpC/P60 family protein [Bacteroidia bacterium]|nr:NlpC/P60 family protein [Bacteroidia bacterium]